MTNILIKFVSNYIFSCINWSIDRLQALFCSTIYSFFLSLLTLLCLKLAATFDNVAITAKYLPDLLENCSAICALIRNPDGLVCPWLQEAATFQRRINWRCIVLVRSLLEVLHITMQGSDFVVQHLGHFFFHFFSFSNYSTLICIYGFVYISRLQSLFFIFISELSDIYYI